MSCIWQEKVTLAFTFLILLITYIKWTVCLIDTWRLISKVWWSIVPAPILVNVTSLETTYKWEFINIRICIIMVTIRKESLMTSRRYAGSVIRVKLAKLFAKQLTQSSMPLTRVCSTYTPNVSIRRFKPMRVKNM